MTGRVQSVAVVGRDAAAWLAALAIRRALGRAGVRVRVIELETRLSTADVYAAVPSVGSMHRLLGLDESIVRDVCHAVPMVAQRFSNWAKGAAPYFIAYDDDPPPGGDLPFSQYWAKGALEGLRVGLEEFSLGTACARLNTVPLVAGEPTSPAASYGYHLDASRYCELVKQLAVRLGVEVTQADLRGVEVTGERIEGVDLADGTRISADLYVDASGTESRLLAQLAGAEFETWGEWLRCDRLLTASAPRLPNLPVYSQISAFKTGWVGLFPLQTRTAVVAAYSSQAMSDVEAVELAGVVARMPVSGEAVVNELRPGIQRRPWLGNCVSVGQSAIAVDPLDALELHVAHGCISHLMTLFPATKSDFPEAEAYNRSIASFGNNLRDFQAAHYLLNRRFDDRWWDDVRESSLPPGLKRKVDMFGARAIVPMNDDESFHEQSWSALLLGSGVKPQGYDPRVDALPAEAHIQKVQQRLRQVASLAKQMPPVAEFIRMDEGSAVQVSK